MLKMILKILGWGAILMSDHAFFRTKHICKERRFDYKSDNSLIRQIYLNVHFLRVSKHKKQ